MRKCFIYASLGALAVTTGPSLEADHGQRGPNRVAATLEGFQEVPAVSTTGHGRFEARIDDDAETITWELSYADLEGHLVENGIVTASHIHVGQRGVNGGVSAFFCGGGGKPACPSEGTLSGVVTPADVIGPNGQGVEPGAFDELVRAIRAGKTYVNVHSTRFPGGEIRGQLFDGDRR